MIIIPTGASRPERRYGGYGWRPDKPDARDRVLKGPSVVQALGLPDEVDLRERDMPPVYDQQQTNSCTGNAGGAYVELIDLWANPNKRVARPSRLFLYHCARAVEGDADQDAGAEIRDIVKCAAAFGAPPETEWAFTTENVCANPSAQVFRDALSVRVASYARVRQTEWSMRHALAQGLPIILGLTLYESFESDVVARTGSVPMPDVRREKVLGGHALLVVGYHHRLRVFIVRNSWGSDWGDKGYCHVPYAYFTNADLCADLWTMKGLLPVGAPVKNVNQYPDYDLAA